MDYIAQLKQLTKQNDYFIGFDSDGCVFDTMEVKHKECFCPAFIKHMGCQPVSKAAREVWDFVNLYSKTRGCNRFLALQYARDLLRSRKDVQARNFKVPELQELDAWIKRETKLGNPALKAEVEKTGNEELGKMLAWSVEVNERVADMVFGMPPFPFVMDVLKQAQGKADMIVVSQTPLEALTREWEENEMDGYIEMIAGQEHGTKTEHIHFATEGKGYESSKILMVGDAPGDYKAAAENQALYYPIIPGNEEASWERLAKEGLAKFFDGTFAGDYQQMLLEEFDAALPENPSWE
ncbi:MAG: HAD hydrolase-like protein [Verrucomicrobia bacterium]|nr:HAD hydrolase-like protein [Verrucomicrobiota bacterium]